MVSISMNRLGASEVTNGDDVAFCDSPQSLARYVNEQAFDTIDDLVTDYREMHEFVDALTRVVMFKKVFARNPKGVSWTMKPPEFSITTTASLSYIP